MSNRRYVEPHYRRFAADLRRAGFKVTHYRGRWFYEGPAVECDDFVEMQRAIRATTVVVQFDNLGLGFIVYPAGSAHENANEDVADGPAALDLLRHYREQRPAEPVSDDDLVRLVCEFIDDAGLAPALARYLAEGDEDPKQ